MAFVATSRVLFHVVRMTAREERCHTVRIPHVLIATLALMLHLQTPELRSAENRWIRVPTGGYVLAVAADPQRRGRLYASSDDFMVSTDVGQHWIAHRWWPGGEVPTLVGVAPSDPRRIYALSSWSGGSAGAGGILRSDDRGETWREYASFDTYDWVYFQCLAIDPGDPDHLFVASDVGLYASDDGGGSFGPRVSPESFVFDPFDGNTLFLASYSRIFRSTDAGLTWQDMSTEWPGTPRRIRQFVVHPAQQGLFYVVSADGVYRLSQ